MLHGSGPSLAFNHGGRHSHREGPHLKAIPASDLLLPHPVVFHNEPPISDKVAESPQKALREADRNQKGQHGQNC